MGKNSHYISSFLQGYIPLHFASLKGHVGVVGLLLSRSTTLLKIADKKGQTCLHVASASGHFEMVQVLLGQGSDYTCADKVNFFKHLNYGLISGVLVSNKWSRRVRIDLDTFKESSRYEMGQESDSKLKYSY